MIVTKHAISQYRSRLTDINDEKTIINIIELILSQSKYVSDNSNGVLLRNEEFMMELIVKDRKVITIYPISKKGRKNGINNKNNRSINARNRA